MRKSYEPGRYGDYAAPRTRDNGGKVTKITWIYGNSRDEILAEASRVYGSHTGPLRFDIPEIRQSMDKPDLHDGKRYYAAEVTVTELPDTQHRPVVGLQSEGFTVTVTKEDIDQAVQQASRNQDTITRKDLDRAISRWRAKGYTIAANANNLFAMAVQPAAEPQPGEVWAEDNTGVMFRRTLNGMWQIFGDNVNYPDGYPHRPMTKIR